MASKAALEIILRARDEASKTVQGASKAFGLLQGAVAGLVAGGLNIAANAVAGLGKAAINYAANATMAVARTSEMAAVLNLLGKRAGWTDGEIRNNVQAMRDLGVRTDVAQNVLAQFARNQLDVADATMAARVAQDLAVLSGRDSSQTLGELNYAIQTQNSGLQVFRDLGIQAGDVLKEFADSLGVSTEELDKSQRMQAMLNAVRERGAEIEGVYATAMEEPGKALRSLSRHFYEASLAVGQHFLPVLSTGVNVVTDFITGIRGLLEEGQPLHDMFAALGELGGTLAQKLGLAATDGFGGLVEAVVPAVEWLTRVIEVVSDFVWMLDVGIEPLDALRMALAAAFGPEVAEEITSFVTSAQSGMETLSGVFGEVWSFILDLVGQAVAWFQENLPLIQQTGQTLADFFQNHVAPAMDNAWTIIKTLVSTALTLITGVITTTMQIINGDWSGAWETIKETTATIWEGIKTVITEFIEGVLNTIGSNLDEFKATWSSNWEMAKTIVSTIWANIVSAVAEKMAEVRSTIEAKLNEVRSFISGFSLRDVGAALIEGLRGGVLSKAQSIADAAASVVRNAISAAKSALGISSPSKVGHEIMANFVGTMADTVRQMREVPAKAVNDMMAQSVQAAGVTPAGHSYVLGGQQLGMPAMAGAGGTVNVTIHNHFGSDSVRTEADIETITRRQQEMLLLRGVRTFEV